MFNFAKGLLGGGSNAFGFTAFDPEEGPLQTPSETSMWTVTRGKAKVGQLMVTVLECLRVGSTDALLFCQVARCVCWLVSDRSLAGTDPHTP
jgi:hypothetical protein